jgi:hypothetical protein
MMTKKLIFLSFAFQLSTAIVLGQQVVPANLVLHQGENPQNVLLPFKYKHLTAEERQKTVWVPQWFYTVINPGSDKLAVVGPLNPCVFVALKNKANGRIVVFNKHRINSMQSLVEIAKREIFFGEDSDPRDIGGIIFTTISSKYKDTIERVYGISQLNVVKNIKDFIIESFRISDRAQIVANVFTNRKQNLDLDNDKSILVILDKNFKPYCTLSNGDEMVFDMNPLIDLRGCEFEKLQTQKFELLVNCAIECGFLDLGIIRSYSVENSSDKLSFANIDFIHAQLIKYFWLRW